MSALDSSATNKLKPHNISVAKYDDVNTSATFSKLPETNQPQQSNNECVVDEQKKNNEEKVTALQNATSVKNESLELGCNDEGLIVIQTDIVQTDVKQKEDDTACVRKEEKPATRTK